MASRVTSAACAGWQDRPVVLMGAGNLAWSLATGALAARVLEPRMLRVTNRQDDGRLERFTELGIVTGRDLQSLFDGAGTVLLLVKPVDAHDALRSAGQFVRPGTIFISAVAGMPTRCLVDALPASAHVVRVMPNTASQVRLAATAVAAGPELPAPARDWIARLFGAVGSVHFVAETDLDAVTAVSGSGTAYVYHFAELLIQAAMATGLDQGLARTLAVETMIGAAGMLARPGADPAVLKAQVASPRGTTEAALAAMDRMRIGDAVHAAVARATQRSREIAESFAAGSARKVQDG